MERESAGEIRTVSSSERLQYLVFGSHTARAEQWLDLARTCSLTSNALFGSLATRISAGCDDCSILQLSG